MLTDTIQKAFDSIFTSAYDNTDAVVTGRKLLEWSASGKALVSPQVLDQVRTLPQVDSAAGTILDISGDTNVAKILDREGHAIDNGNPTFGLGVNPADQRFSPFKLVDGTWASGPNQVVVDKGTADDQHFTVGERIRIAGDGPAKPYTLTGIAKFGDVSSLGGATVALFDVKTAQAVLHKDGFDAISVAAKSGVSDDQLVRAIDPTLPENTVVARARSRPRRTGRAATSSSTSVTSCSPSAAWRCSSAASSSSTRSRSRSRSARASWRPCGRSAPPGSRCCAR